MFVSNLFLLKRAILQNQYQNYIKILKHYMDNQKYQKLYHLIKQNLEYYKDQLRLGGVLYKYAHPGIDIFPSSLTPFAIKSEEFQFLRKAQPLWDKLLYLTSQDKDFVNQIFKVTAQHDTFVLNYLKLFNQTQHYKQQIVLSITRNDYLKDGITGKWKLVEFNTLAVANGGISQKLQNVMFKIYHQGTLRKNIYKQNIEFPKSLGYENTLNLMYKAFTLYNNPKAILLIIGQSSQKNIYDHKYIGNFFQNKGVNYMMLSLDQAVDGVKCQNQRVFYDEKQVAILYFRSGASLKQYNQKTWNFKKNIQLTKAIKVPTIDLQLINFKRAQIQLCKQEIMSKYLSPEEVQILMQAVTFGMHMEDIQDFSGFLSQLDYNKYVLKPNKEGGGNNIYGQQIISTLKLVGKEGAKAYVLMDKIADNPKLSIQCRVDGLNLIESCTEFGQIGGTLVQNGFIIQQAIGGILLRTKPIEANEGGIAKGSGGIDSLVIELPK